MCRQWHMLCSYTGLARWKILSLSTALGLALGSIGCVGVPVVPTPGLIYTEIDAPLSEQISKCPFPDRYNGRRSC